MDAIELPTLRERLQYYSASVVLSLFHCSRLLSAGVGIGDALTAIWTGLAYDNSRILYRPQISERLSLWELQEMAESCLIRSCDSDPARGQENLRFLAPC